MDIVKVRENYPQPQAAERIPPDDSDAYCVGGACVLYATQHGRPQYLDRWAPNNIRFPDILHLSLFIQEMNPEIDAMSADQYAEEVIEENDAGYFDNAWEVMQHAMQAEVYIDPEER